MFKSIATTALSAIMAITAVAPVQAFPLPAVDSPSTRVVQVQFCLDGNMHCDRYRQDRYRNDYRYRDSRDAYHTWNGQRGYRYYRPGYRRHSDGWWYPLAAFGLGAAIIGGMAAQAPRPPVVAVPADHVRWCQARYRSYDVYSDTFQPNRGPRQRCISPY